ncbi:DedA family protein [Thiobacter aerophilum]|uniref:DedA family protein n=1 Tax=Thiobacter aerophilum TaxID=3121275 RepID=A0ABV0EGJ8_9BURK
MDVALLISRWGLLAVLLGSLLEGETVLVLAGFAAHRGYLDFAQVVAVAWLGAVLGDQFWFWLGRRHGRTFLARWPKQTTAIRRALRLIERHPARSVLFMRFAWGLRIALPVAMGMSGLPHGRFLLLNGLSAMLWAPAIAGAGWLFGDVLVRHLGDLARVEHWAALALVLLVLAVHLVERRWARRRTARDADRD